MSLSVGCLDDAREREFKARVFHHLELDPKTSWYSACIRVQDLSILDQAWRNLDWSAFPNSRITEFEPLEG